MKYDLMLIGPPLETSISTIPVRKSVKSAALYSSVHTLLQPLPQTFSLQSRSIRTIPMYWMHFIWTATISPCCPPNALP